MKRRELLPEWARLFAWAGLLSPVFPMILLIGLVVESQFHLFAFGLSSQGPNICDPVAFYITGIATLAFAVSYGILWGKDWAIALGIAYSLIGIATEVYTVFVSFYNNSFYIPFSLILMIPFLVVLIKKRKEWAEFPQRP